VKGPARFPTLRTEIAEISVARLAREFGTPLFVYDAATIVQRIADLRPFDVTRYSQKANSNLAVLDLCRRHGALVDCVSAGEIRRALAAGYLPRGDPDRIVYTADIFDREALDLVVEHGIHVNCGSPDMIEQYGHRAPGGEITLRINPGFGHGHSQKTNTGGEQSKHGIWHEQIADCVARAAHYDLAVSGVHVHIGSGSDLDHLSTVSEALQEFALEIGPSVTSISAGGGLPVPYRDGDERIEIAEHFSRWDATRRRLERAFGHAIRLEIEPGRYVTAEAGSLVCEIRAVKTMGKNVFYVVDAGFSDLARPVLYGAYHPISIVPAEGTGEDRPLQDVVVGGPLCESGDIFTQEEGGFVATRALPEARVGEFLVLECAGAYGFTMASNYNSKPRAAEVLVRDGKVDLVRARETFEDLIRGETIPPSAS
jgi:diaminopimelate decarboxylase